MARNKSSRYGSIADDLNFGKASERALRQNNAQEAQEAQETREAQEVYQAKAANTPAPRREQPQDAKEDAPLELGQTQGRKGKKLKRVTMAFSDLNYEYMIRESRLRGMSATAFVNSLIEKERKGGFSS